MTAPFRAATELVTPSVVRYDRQPMPLDAGSLLLHAIPSDEELQAVCGMATRRLPPTGHSWQDCPLTTPRSAACLTAQPLDHQ